MSLHSGPARGPCTAAGRSASVRVPVQVAHELKGPDAIVFGAEVEQVHLVAKELDAGRVQLLLAQGVAAAVLLVQVVMGEELGKQEHQQAQGEVADGQAALVDTAKMLVAEQAVGAGHLAPPSWAGELQFVQVDRYQSDLLGAAPLALEAIFHPDY